MIRRCVLRCAAVNQVIRVVCARRVRAPVRARRAGNAHLQAASIPVGGIHHPSSSSAASVRPIGTLEDVTKVEKSEQEWRRELAPEQYRVLREKGTEAPFSGEYDHTFEPGTYRCAGCGAELFDSDAKYDSGCGWPAFSAPAGQDAVDEEVDTTYGMVRTEVLCASCGGHLGHVFPDGPHPTGLRYCINSAALKLDER